SWCKGQRIKLIANSGKIHGVYLATHSREGQRVNLIANSGKAYGIYLATNGPQGVNCSTKRLLLQHFQVVRHVSSFPTGARAWRISVSRAPLEHTKNESQTPIA